MRLSNAQVLNDWERQRAAIQFIAFVQSGVHTTMVANSDWPRREYFGTMPRKFYRRMRMFAAADIAERIIEATK